MANMEGKKMVVVRVKLVNALKRLAKKEKMLLQDVVEFALKTFIEANK